VQKIAALAKTAGLRAAVLAQLDTMGFNPGELTTKTAEEIVKLYTTYALEKKPPKAAIEQLMAEAAKRGLSLPSTEDLKNAASIANVNTFGSDMKASGRDWSVYAVPAGIVLVAAAAAWYFTRQK
jgi:hypothetical protein